MKGKVYKLEQNQKEFLEKVLSLDITRWPWRITRILAEKKYDDDDRIKMNEVRMEYLKYKRGK